MGAQEKDCKQVSGGGAAMAAEQRDGIRTLSDPTHTAIVFTLQDADCQAPRQAGRQRAPGQGGHAQMRGELLVDKSSHASGGPSAPVGNAWVATLLRPGRTQ